ncbi:carboxypeptidase regulatory-like domain-containing protein [Domibacillus sp. PGB-M46]|uniref:SpaA isopeptide-forming pilin-related protein n=1 Tax=Domibacillus sp. PGB-M46 TaxID=2910255 RepID=UPI001F5A98C6|nr:SpaA isopeptide-forming pilin-related protein [Domibacillus sp. PGB-M46]MCI2253063.1 carboxypeptidase regulatory-like domain-containing protein [Domibacillus sp. PGB-M46]
MKKWLMLLTALFVVIGIMQPAQAAAETAFYTKSAVAHTDGTTTPVYALNEPMTLQIDWVYSGEEPALYKVPTPFYISKDGEEPLKTSSGETVGTLKMNAADNTAIAVLEEDVQSGAKGTAKVPVVFKEDKLAKIGAYGVAFPTGEQLSFTITEEAGGAIKMVALDAKSKEKLAGASFTIVNEGGKVVASLKTNSAGEASVPNLPFGTYTVTQTAAPDGYAVPLEPWKLDLNTVLVTKEIMHEKSTGLTGALNITAVEKGTAVPIAGAEFELKTENGLYSKKVVTDEKGKASLTGLSYGTYKMTQTKTDSDYVLPTESWTVTIGRQTPVEQKVENSLVNAYGALKVTLTDASSGAELKGAEFSLYDEEKELVSKVVTDDNGVASFTSLKAGSYKLEETDAPDGYTRSTGQTDVTIKSGETVDVEMENTKIAKASSTTTSVKTKAAGTGTLPQTGDESDALYLFAGVLLAAGAWLLMRKGKRA